MIIYILDGDAQLNYKKDSELYLKMYRGLEKWINECPICHSKGYKPDMPEQISNYNSVAAKNIRHYFRPLEVDEMGFCLQCSRNINRKNLT